MTDLTCPAKSFDVYAGTIDDAHMQEMWDSGFRVVQHYYSRTPNKNLMAAGAKALTAQGFRLGVVWEANGNSAAAFSAIQGQQDAMAALALAKAVGQPQESAIYFAVDFDPPSPGINQFIVPYFRAVCAVIRPAKYKVGAYGCGNVLKALFTTKLMDYDWLAGAAGWGGTGMYRSAFDPANGRPAITQGLEGKVDGLDIDPDTVYREAGLFQVS